MSNSFKIYPTHFSRGGEKFSRGVFAPHALPLVAGLVKRERTKSIERVLLTIRFDVGHLQHESKRPDTERKYLNSDKAQCRDPKLTTIISEVCGGTSIQSNQACILQYYKS